MKQTNISVFIPHAGCPYDCSFCNQRNISGYDKIPVAADVRAVLKEQSANLADKNMTAQIAFFGGSFTALDFDYMNSLLSAANEYIGSVYTGIRISTRPDCISEEILKYLRKMNVKAIELGAQSMDDEVLFANNRGHTSSDTVNAAEMIRDYGFELGLQMMTGLYKDTAEKSEKTAYTLAELKPDTIRVYPTVVLKGTELDRLLLSGEFTPLGFDETVDLCANLLELFESKNIKVIRMGLHASELVESKMTGGVYHQAFREICESKLYLNKMTAQMNKLGGNDFVIYTCKSNISKITGHKKSNIEYLKKLGITVKIKEKFGLNQMEIEKNICTLNR